MVTQQQPHNSILTRWNCPSRLHREEPIVREPKVSKPFRSQLSVFGAEIRIKRERKDKSREWRYPLNMQRNNILSVRYPIYFQLWSPHSNYRVFIFSVIYYFPFSPQSLSQFRHKNVTSEGLENDDNILIQFKY